MACNLFTIALTVQKLLRFYYENFLSGSTFECESGATNVKDEPSILSYPSFSLISQKITIYIAKCTSFAEFNFFKRIKIFFFISMQIYCHMQLHAVTREKIQPPPLIVMPTRDLLDIFLLHIRKKWLNLLLVQ